MTGLTKVINYAFIIGQVLSDKVHYGSEFQNTLVFILSPLKFGKPTVFTAIAFCLLQTKDLVYGLIVCFHEDTRYANYYWM